MAMKIVSLGAAFLEPFLAPDVDALIAVDLLSDPEPQIAPHADATFALGMNTAGGENVARLWAARAACTRRRIPTVWWTLEDPNSFGTFAPQADGFDLVCTSDAEMIPRYLEYFPRMKLLWLPLAAQPALHQPRPLTPDAADLVLAANWYTNEARLAGVRTILDPLIAAGYSLNLYAYATPAWPERYRRYWRGATSVYDVARWYATGRVVLGLNNQAWGTAMCSMRTFEALACGKPFLSFHSDAYVRLGFVNAWPGLAGDGHFVWVQTPAEAIAAAGLLLADRDATTAMAERGRAFVLSHHTYAHRLQAIREALGV
jgi:spore maturation protein CgeB